jgi:hypothetical protein
MAARRGYDRNRMARMVGTPPRRVLRPSATGSHGVGDRRRRQPSRRRSVAGTGARLPGSTGRRCGVHDVLIRVEHDGGRSQPEEDELHEGLPSRPRSGGPSRRRRSSPDASTRRDRRRPSALRPKSEPAEQSSIPGVERERPPLTVECEPIAPLRRPPPTVAQHSAVQMLQRRPGARSPSTIRPSTAPCSVRCTLLDGAAEPADAMSRSRPTRASAEGRLRRVAPMVRVSRVARVRYG